MNVALFFTYDVSLKDWEKLGFLERELQLYNSITKNYDIQFTFITYGKDDENYLIPNNQNIKVISIGNLLKTNNKFLKYLSSISIPFKLKKELKNIDILKTNQLMGSWVPIILKYITKKPLILRTGYDALEFAIKDNKSKFKIMLYFLLTFLSLKASDIYCVSSKKDIANINRRFRIVHNKEIRHRPNWVNIVDAKIDIKNRNINRLLCVGRLEDQKNYINLIKNISDSKLEIDIIGSGSLEKEIKDFAHKKHVKIDLIGNLDHSALMKLYENYIFYILFSKYEGHPKSLIEAMSKGCIPIVLENENTFEIIKHNDNGILLGSEIDSVEKWVIDLLKNKKEMERLSSNAKEFVKKNYSLNKVVKSEIDDYKILINENR